LPQLIKRGDAILFGTEFFSPVFSQCFPKEADDLLSLPFYGSLTVKPFLGLVRHFSEQGFYRA